MSVSRRKSLDGVSSGATTHTGLWLAKYLPEQVKEGASDAKWAHFERAVAQRVPELYQPFFARWQKTLQAAGAVCRSARTQGRMVVGLGEDSVLEAAITLHHTYGVPYIPGSALKGLAARYANKWLASETWGQGADAYTTVFGAAAEAGYITFFDALYIPGSADGGRPLALDVVAVHHRDYYSGADPAPPADWDSPVPIPLLSATGAYLVAMHGVESWVEAAFEILSLAFAEEGVGAKTSSGYGRLTFDPESGNTSVVDVDITQEASQMDQPRTPADLSPGQVLQGRVVNIVSFGAFVDIGVGQDGLVHVSELAEGYVNDVSNVVSEGQVVRVKVLSVERRKKWRIGLTMKLD